jgi:hypothetical protein
MRLVRSLSGVVVAAFLAAAVLVAPAAAAPAAMVIGQVGKSTNTGAHNSDPGGGGCKCTAVQLADTGTHSYVFPYSGVVTEVSTYSNGSVEATDTLQPETLDLTLGVHGAVVNAGILHSLAAAHGGLNRFRERMPVHANEVLAESLHDSYYLGATPYEFESGNAADLIGGGEPALGPGDAIPSANEPKAKERVNLSAVLEPDEDHDGYGDVSQDLCPGSPIATTACSGSLFGSNLQDEWAESGHLCAVSCMYVQSAIGGASTATTAPGVIVRWRVLNQQPGPYRIEVVTPNTATTGGVFRGYHVLEKSAVGNVAAAPAVANTYQASSFPARVPIPAGAYVGLVVPENWFPALTPSPGGESTFSLDNAPAEGVTAVTGENHNGTVEYDADIEPDVDGDGYGDVTQDSCPSSAAVHEGPCPAGPPAFGGGTGTNPLGITERPTPTTPPRINGLKVAPKSFRVKPLGAAPAKGHFGAQVKLTLSAAAKVTLAIETKHGHRFQTVTELSKTSPAGASKIALSGQYRHAGKLTDLAPGTYRLTATAKSGTATGPAARTTFTVLPPV